MNTTLFLVIGSICCVLILFGFTFHWFVTYYRPNLHDHFMIITSSCIDYGKGSVIFFCEPSVKNKSTELSELITWAKRSGYRIAQRHEVELALQRIGTTDNIQAFCSEADGKFVTLPEGFDQEQVIPQPPLISLIKATPLAA
jgi:hypothetical protein